MMMKIDQPECRQGLAADVVLPLWNYKQLDPGASGADQAAFNTSDSQPVTENSTAEETAPEEAILCALCRHEITSPRQKITVHGAHEHTFVNPAGHIFHLGCYQDASGCLQRGELTTEHTWFQGYAWNYALCGQCFSHLGWVFHGSDVNIFFGLITDKLIFS